MEEVKEALEVLKALHTEMASTNIRSYPLKLPVLERWKSTLRQQTEILSKHLSEK